MFSNYFRRLWAPSVKPVDQSVNQSAQIAKTYQVLRPRVAHKVAQRIRKTSKEGTPA